MKRLICFDCDKEGHEDNQMNQICIDQNCQEKGLMCIMCQYEFHQQHKSMPLKIFLYEYKQSLQNYRKIQLKQTKNNKVENSSPEKQKIKNIKEISVGILENFQSFVNEQIDLCKQEITKSFDRKFKKAEEKYIFEEEDLIKDIEENQLASAKEMKSNINQLIKKVKGTNNDDINQLIIEVKGQKELSDQENLMQQIGNMEEIGKQVSGKLSAISQTLLSALKLYQGSNVASQNAEDNQFTNNFLIENKQQQQYQDIQNLYNNMNNQYEDKNYNDSQNQQQQNIDKDRLYNTDSNKIQEENYDKFKKEQGNDSLPRLKPYYKKQENLMPQIDKVTAQTKKDIKTSTNNQKKQENGQKQKQNEKMLTRTAQQTNNIQKKETQGKAGKFIRKQIVHDTMDDLFSSQAINLLNNQEQDMIQDQKISNSPCEMPVQEEKEENSDQDSEGKQLQLRISKKQNNQNQNTADIDQEAMQDMYQHSQRNQQKFFQLKQNQSQTNMNNDEDQGDIRLDIKHKKPIYAHSGIIKDIIFLDLERLATCGFDKLVKIWKVNGQEIKTLQQHTKIVQKLAYSAELKLLASVGMDNNIILWNDKQNLFDIQIQQAKCHERGIMSVIFLEDQQQIISAGGDRYIKIWKIEKNILNLVQNIQNKEDICFSVMYSKIKRQIISGGQQYISIWKKTMNDCQGKKNQTKNKYSNAKVMEQQQPVKVIDAHTDFINKILCLIINNEAVIISGSDDCTVKIWSAFDFSLQGVIQESQGVQGISFIDMTGILVLGLWEQNVGGGKICFWDISEENTKLQEVEQISSGTTSVIINDDNSYLISSHENGNLELFQLTYDID